MDGYRTEPTLMIGATSDMGRVIVRKPAAGRWRVQFAVRDLGRWERGAQGRRVRAGVAPAESEGVACRDEVDSRLIPDKERRGQVSGMTGSGWRE